ncbi:MAG: two-component system response regulator QseB [Lacunisphaera sp.]|nr:two-component system response regulator QseB [Lacunisphaera sp.]
MNLTRAMVGAARPRVILLIAPPRRFEAPPPACIPETVALCWVQMLRYGDQPVGTLGCDAIVFDRSLSPAGSLAPVEDWRALGFQGPILVWSERMSAAERVAAFELGVDEVLETDVGLAEMVCRVSRRLAPANSQPPQELRHFEIEMDAALNSVLVRGRAVELARTERAILRCLLLGRGNVVPRSVIVRQVWPPADQVSPNLLDVHVSQLRRKLEPFAGRRVILCLRGRGYALAPGAEAPLAMPRGGEAGTSREPAAEEKNHREEFQDATDGRNFVFAPGAAEKTG